ncbi:sulfite exporter TauE/SafE family protein [Kribbella sindirgiensis]|uniref:Probable membrane transporter protein n=1 Tax=Kribbella sindirgiensis TaxID=1124744 RepID=A0A4R0IQR7_9ACTN|nr:sulfite exporter TauE/SafE family protein [Kribbella sindirgiensis]TCC33638.1 sulfite exporter TauE/SafE family protein [Kribbella sindirgiensis]
MRRLILIALLGSIAQLVDGTLGMAYGVTASTALLITGITPAIASASVHLAEVGTTLASGLSHWRFGNVDWRVVALIGAPGAVGAFAGATFLSSLSTESASLWVAGLLLLLGVYILVRFGTGKVRAVIEGRPAGRFLGPLGLVAGFIDATGGGGWGPVANSALLSSGKLAPRRAVGSVNAAEFLVSVAASIGFLFGLGGKHLPFDIVAALLIGGVIAAPLAAWLVSRLATRWLGVGVGLVLILTNARTVLNGLDVTTGPRYAVYAALVLGWAAIVAYGVRVQARRTASAVQEAERLLDENELEPVS